MQALDHVLDADTPRPGPTGDRLDAVSRKTRRTLSRPILGALAVTGAALCYATTAVCIRVMSSELNPFMIGLLRNTFGLLFFLPLLVRAGTGAFRTTHWPVHLVRTFCAIVSGLLYFWALGRVALAEATALNFTGPIFVAMGAVALLGERMGARRWTAIVVGFLGILVILRPGFQTIGPGLLAVLGSALVWAGMVLANKSLARTETMTQIVLLNLVVAAPVSLLLALPVWQWPSPPMVALGAVQGLLGTLAHLFMARAFQLADASHVMPFDFLRLPFTVGLAFVFFTELPDTLTVVGATIVFATTTYIALRARTAGQTLPPTSIQGYGGGEARQ